MKKLNIEKIIATAMLLFAVGFNLWLYKLEPTVTIDPNDNTFQFALVDRTNSIWDFAHKKCSSTIAGILTYPICHFSYLADHWVHNWAVGFNLPYYYSHIPQIVIVGTWRLISLFNFQLSLFNYYHIVIYLLLCLIPLPVFMALRVMGLPWLTAGVGALLATHLSTDGLYGLDPSSFLWRGYGLSSQLFAILWLPLALAYAYRYFTSQATGSKNIVLGKIDTNIPYSKYLPLAIIFTTLTTAGHLGIGMICMLSLGFLALAAPIMKLFREESGRDILSMAKDQFIRLTLVAGISIFLLSYWILPTFIDGNFHNISFWDPVWKFDSYGAKEVIVRLFNGDLLDWGRLPYVTILTFLGVVTSLSFRPPSRNLYSDEKRNLIINSKAWTPDRARGDTIPQLAGFGILFIFWLIFYFGRTTWGGLIDLIPGMRDFHLSRFIVGVHVASMLLAPIGFSWIVERITTYLSKIRNFQFSIFNFQISNHSFIKVFVYLIIGLLLLPPIYKWTLTYNELNDRLIVQAIDNHKKVMPDETKLFAKLRSLPPARIFAGRGGGYGKTFQVAETPYFMHLSTYGLPTSLWLPETWSMNSDTEQYFSDGLARDYDLYNLRWIVAPPEEEPKEFWKQIDESPTWKLYETSTSGYFTVGVRPATVSVEKTNLINLVHLWVQSDNHENGLYPELTFDKHYPKATGLPNFKMTDEVTYLTPDNTKHNVWMEPPVYLPPGTVSYEEYKAREDKSIKNIKVIGPESVDDHMIFSTKVEIKEPCVGCIVVLKQTAHPGWKAYVDGKPAKTMIVFPFYTAVLMESPGTHTVTLAYEPSKMKIFLLVAAIAFIAGTIVFLVRRRI